MTERRILSILSTIVLVAGIVFFSHGTWIWAKARLAQVLLQVAWQRTLSGTAEAKPWPWADTWPVARLVVSRLNADEIVLAGASGRTMAFGPGHMDGSGMPGEHRNCVLTAHRDTHFAFLRNLRTGDVIELQDAHGRTWNYRVRSTEVVDQRETRVTSSANGATLTLVTCYPFFALVPGGPQRYVVTADLLRA